MATIAIGVIGAGGMGTRHIMNIHSYVKNASVSAIYDLDQARASQVAEECGTAKAIADPLQLIRDASVNAVLIASPDPTHAEFVHACLQQRKPVLCEKPLAMTAADALHIIEAEQSLGSRLVSVGFMRRFDPQHVAVRQAVLAGQVGRPILFKGVHRNPMILPYLPGDGVVTNSAIHDIDSMRWLLGQEIVEVYVRGVRTHDSFDEKTRDMLLLQMTLSGNCLATVEVSVAVEYGYEVSAEIVGERGSILASQPQEVVLRSQGTCSTAVAKNHLIRFQPAYIPEVTEWVHALQSGRAFRGANAWDGYASLLIADACVQSLHSGLPVAVSMPEKPSLYQEREL